MRRAFATALLPLIILTSCGPREEVKSEPATPATAPRPPAAEPVRSEPWLFCDSIDQPVIIIAQTTDGGRAARFEIHSKTGEAPRTTTAMLGRSEGAAGSVFQNLARGGADFGYVRSINPGMLAEESDAYTQPVVSVRIEGQDYSCRWLARTRFAGFTARRSIFITQDSDGDLIYQTFDFTGAANAQAIDLDGAQRSTTFSVEVRGGEEETNAAGQSFAFENKGYRYEVAAPKAGEGGVRVLRAGRELLNEPLIAFQTGPD